MRSHLEIELGACVPILTPKYISSRFFENQPNEIYRHLSEKASKSDHACFDVSLTLNLRKAHLHSDGAKAFWPSIVVARTP